MKSQNLHLNRKPSAVCNTPGPVCGRGPWAVVKTPAAAMPGPGKQTSKEQEGLHQPPLLQSLIRLHRARRAAAPTQCLRSPRAAHPPRGSPPPSAPRRVGSTDLSYTARLQKGARGVPDPPALGAHPQRRLCPRPALATLCWPPRLPPFAFHNLFQEALCGHAQQERAGGCAGDRPRRQGPRTGGRSAKRFRRYINELRPF